MSETITLDCGHPPMPTGGWVVRDGQGRTMCYACADSAQAAELADPATVKFTAYVSVDGKSITTWSGGVLARIKQFYAIPAGFGASQWYVRAVDIDGAEWYGRNGGPGMYVNLRRAKA